MGKATVRIRRAQPFDQQFEDRAFAVRVADIDDGNHRLFRCVGRLSWRCCRFPPRPQTDHQAQFNRAIIVGETAVFGLLEGRDLIDGHIGDRQIRASPAAEIIVDFAAGKHHPTTIGQRAEALRQEISFDERVDRIARLAFAGRREFGQLH